MKIRQNSETFLRFAIIAGLIFIFAQMITAQRLKPTEIVYSRLPSDLSQPPVGANSPTVWAVGQDGSNDRQITTGMQPRVSDDGRYLLFRRLTCTTQNFPYCYNPYAEQPTGQLWMRDLANNSETMVLDYTVAPNQFALYSYYFTPFSNQGNYQIIFDLGNTIYRMNVDGSNRTVNSGQPYIMFPAARRNDSLIVAHTTAGCGPTPITCRLVTETIGGVRTDVPNSGGASNPSWSNDNQYIGFSTFDGSRRFSNETSYYPYFFRGIGKIKPDGTGRTQLLDINATDQNTNGIALGTIWTEDNSKIIVAARINGIAGIYAVKTDGSGAFSQIPISAGNAPDFVGGIVQPRVEQNVASLGGGLATNGNYSLVSTIGETIAGQTSVGGNFNFESGFWATFKAAKKSVFDFDGDSKTDIGIFRPSTGAWWINSTLTNVTTAIGFGNSSDKLVPGDFTGDGKTDIAFFRPSTGQWFILRSENYSFYGFPFGASTDIATPGDFDGDGKTDAAVFRPSNAGWYILRSSDGGVTSQSFGTSEDRPVVADYDGDGKDDIAIFRPSTSAWWIQKSSDNAVFAVQFGQTGDKTVQGDYTGDGKADLAFYRPSTGYWYILRSNDNSFYGFPFGLSEDAPSPGDYDGDGKFDAAVFRPSNSGWYLQRSSSGTTSLVFGTTGDIPVPGAFVR